jgi:formate dehydrogenase assembly factor FdhD
VQLARELGLTLVGFLRGRRFVIYAREERISVSALAQAGVS